WGGATLWSPPDRPLAALGSSRAGSVVLAVTSRVLNPQRIDDNFAWLKGADPAYLAALCDWPGYELSVGGERIGDPSGAARAAMMVGPGGPLRPVPASSRLATAAAVAGGLSILVCPAPLALVLGIVALVNLRAHPERGGRGRAWFGTIMGGVFSALLAVALIVPSSLPKPASIAPAPPPSVALSSAEARLSVPGAWKSRKDLNQKAGLGACHPREQSCVILLTDRRANFRTMSLEGHSESTRRSLTRSLQDLQVSPPRRFLVAGHPALQYEIRGAHNNLNLVYLHTTIET